MKRATDHVYALVDEALPKFEEAAPRFQSLLRSVYPEHTIVTFQRFEAMAVPGEPYATVAAPFDPP